MARKSSPGYASPFWIRRKIMSSSRSDPWFPARTCPLKLAYWLGTVPTCLSRILTYFRGGGIDVEKSAEFGGFTSAIALRYFRPGFRKSTWGRSHFIPRSRLRSLHPSGSSRHVSSPRDMMSPVYFPTAGILSIH